MITHGHLLTIGVCSSSKYFTSMKLEWLLMAVQWFKLLCIVHLYNGIVIEICTFLI